MLESFFKGLYDVKLFWRKWLPEGDRKATILVAHGVNEHSERYINVANAVIPEGIAVYVLDHRGHGRSEGKRAYVKKFANYIEDVKIFFDTIVKKEAEDKPIFILGHSMGSIIAMNYVKMYPNGLCGMVLSGTGKRLGGIPSFLTKFSKILGAILPKLYINPPIPFEDSLSRDEETIRKYAEDPMCGGKLSLRLGAEMSRALKNAYKEINQIMLPILVQCGEKDPIFEGKEELFTQIASKDKTLKIYKDLKHEIYNELIEDRKTVLNDLVSWLNGHI